MLSFQINICYNTTEVGDKMKIKYTLIKKEDNTKARLGKLETNYGIYDTPMFMPVGTRASV